MLWDNAFVFILRPDVVEFSKPIESVILISIMNSCRVDLFAPSLALTF